MTDETYVEGFPYIITKELILKNVSTFTGKSLIITNPYMFRDVKMDYF